MTDKLPPNVREMATAIWAVVQGSQYGEPGWSLTDHTGALLTAMGWLVGGYSQARPREEHAGMKWDMVTALANAIDAYQQHPNFAARWPAAPLGKNRSQLDEAAEQAAAACLPHPQQ